MQEGDVQIKGYPIRLPLDVLLVFTANPEDYTARGKIITPLKDRMGSEIRTHYPATVEEGMAITAQEAWTRAQTPATSCRCRITFAKSWSRSLFWRAKTSASTALGRQPALAHRLRWKPVVSSAEQRAARNRESPRLGARRRRLRRDSRHHRQDGTGIRRRTEGRGNHRPRTDPLRGRQGLHQVIWPRPICSRWCNGSRMGGDLKIPENATAAEQLAALRRIQGLLDHIDRLGANAKPMPPLAAAAGRIHPRRAVGAQAHQPQRRARLLRRAAQAGGAARAAQPAAAPPVQLRCILRSAP